MPIGFDGGERHEDEGAYAVDRYAKADIAAPITGVTQPPNQTVREDFKALESQPTMPLQAPRMPAGALESSPPILPSGQFSPAYLGRIEAIYNRVDIDTSHDVKSGAVASKDSNKVYIDPDIPPEFHPFLAVHEETEKHLMAGGMPYDRAHTIATLTEKDAVEGAGISWNHYTDAVDPHVAAAEAKKGTGNGPPDPHIDPAKAEGHHADKAATLEAADKKIVSDADERPVAGQQYAMAPRRTIFPQEEGINAEINANATGMGGRIQSGQGPGQAGVIPGYKPTEIVTPSIPNKINLKKDVEGSPGYRTTRFDFMNEKGLKVGYIKLTKKGEAWTNPDAEGTKDLYVDMVGVTGGPQSLGKPAMKDILKQIKTEYPEAERLYGLRVSGARNEAGSGAEEAYLALKPGVKAMTEQDIANRDRRREWNKKVKGGGTLDTPTQVTDPNVREAIAAIARRRAAADPLEQQPYLGDATEQALRSIQEALRNPESAAWRRAEPGPSRIEPNTTATNAIRDWVEYNTSSPTMKERLTPGFIQDKKADRAYRNYYRNHDIMEGISEDSPPSEAVRRFRNTPAMRALRGLSSSTNEEE